ncbi:MAG TPA: type 1 glutamine amidotransferase domain-containing protein [Jatrophihabitantaceae bacterium]|nr:type 1 glutamine amidotransferase domain-containing protein [Jatrophihabitantaceae bacterium]
MANELNGKRVAFLVANEGIEQVELTSPWQAVQEAGGEPVLVAPEKGKAQAFKHLDRADTFPVDLQTSEAKVEDFDAVVLPGGVANPDRLRTDKAAVAFVARFANAGKPVAAICHGPWTLVEAGVVRGKTLTSWPSLQTDVRNAGGAWQDTEVFTCRENGWTLITSRKPDDLPAFNDAAVKAFAAT